MPTYMLTADIEGAMNGSAFPQTVREIGQHLIQRFVPTATFGTWGAWADVDWSFYAKGQTNVAEPVYKAVNDAGGYLFVDGNRVWQTGDFYAEFEDADGLAELRDDRTADPLVEQSSVKQISSAGPAALVRIGHSRNWTVMGVDDISPIALDFEEDVDELRSIAEVAEASAGLAQADKQVATTRLGNAIANGELDRAEKRYWIRQYQNLLSAKTTAISASHEYPYLLVGEQADDLEEAWTALDAYLASLDPAWNNVNLTTLIDEAFADAWGAVYDASVALSNAVATAARSTADWGYIWGDGKPEDNATVGAPPGTNVGNTPAEQIEDSAYITAKLLREMEDLQMAATQTLAANFLETKRIEQRTNEEFLIVNTKHEELRAEFDSGAGGAIALIEEEQIARVAGDAANAEATQTVSSSLAGVSSTVASHASTLVTQGSALSSLTSTVTSQGTTLTGLSATVTTQGTTLTTTNNSLASLTSTVNSQGTTLSGLSATVTTQGTTLTTQGSSIATLQTTVSSQGTTLSGLSGSVTTLQSTVTTQGSTLSTLQSTVTSQGTTITSNTSAITSLNGNITSVLAKNGVTLDVNGYVTGYQQLNNGTSGSFIINTNYFALIKPGGGARMEWQNGAIKVIDAGGVVRVQIGDLSV